MMKVKVQMDGRITLPKQLREQVRIYRGQWLEIALQDGQLLLRSTESFEA